MNTKQTDANGKFKSPPSTEFEATFCGADRLCDYRLFLPLGMALKGKIPK
jgi:hypothetical protein